MSNPHKEPLLHVATIGRTVGLKGDMKLHVKSDFPEQFTPGATFRLQNGESVTLSSVNGERQTIRIEGINTPEDAKRLTNAKLYTTYEATREQCELDEGEFFWFDIIGCEVFEAGVLLGSVKEIERIGLADYLSIKTDAKLLARGLSKQFLLPYQDPFILKTDTEGKRIDVAGAMDILEAS